MVNTLMLRILAMVAATALLQINPAAAQRSPIAVPKPIPQDLSPQVNTWQCGHFRGHYGPMDFRTADPRDRRVVEEWHFDMELQTFLSGLLAGTNMAGTGSVVWGFAYTLKSFPNHPVALLVMEQLGRKLKSEKPQNVDISLECWFMRAFMIAPDDPTVRALYGIYLAHRGRTGEALLNLKVAQDSNELSTGIQYQVGLTYLNLKQFDAAQLIAMRLVRAGYPLETIQRRVREAGRWNYALTLPPDPVDVESSESALPAVNAASAPRQAASAASTR